MLTRRDVLQAKLAQLHRHAEVMLESVLNNPNITEESIKTMAQHDRWVQRSPRLQSWRSWPTRAPEEAYHCEGSAAGMPLICSCKALQLHGLIRRLTCAMRCVAGAVSFLA